VSGCSYGRTTKTNFIKQEIPIIKPVDNNISKSGVYSLDCRTTYYTGAVIGGEILDETYIKISESSERETLYVDNNTAKFFGSDYNVIQDDSQYLIIMRHYSFSGLTEVVSINKKTGIGFDTKTLSFGISGGPNTDTYILTCAEI
jgi:hypothetical protein